MRQQRLALSLESRAKSAERLAERLLHHPEMIHAQRIAAYLSVGGEVDLQPTIHGLWQRGQAVYLPVLHPFRTGYLVFARYQTDTRLCRNRLAILEPECAPTDWLAPWELDVVLTPLVAFDSAGHRLGMGGGFYDRSFAFVQEATTPRLMGCAYAWQQVPVLATRSWDVPLQAVVTD